MRLLNATKKKLLAVDLKKASTFWDKVFGLVDKRNPRSLLLETHFGVHTFFLTQPIDILILDKKNRVAQLKIGLEPFCFYFYNPIHNLILELPAGILKKTNTTIGDKILFE